MKEEKPTVKTAVMERFKKLEPPATSHISVVLNGAFNGASILGGISSLRDWHLEKNGKISDFRFSKTTMFATVLGITIGAWFGKREADNLKKFQTAVKDEICQLRADVDAHANAHDKAAAAR